MKRASLIIPVSIVIHLIIINLTLFTLSYDTYNDVVAIVYYNLSWLLITFAIDFYPTKRNERFFTSFHKVLGLFFIFSLAYFTNFSFRNLVISPEYQLKVLLVIFSTIMIYRYIFYYLRDIYRVEGGNFVSVVVIGRDRKLKKIRQIFDQPELGYRYRGYFDNNPSKSITYLGNIDQAFEFIRNNTVDEVYCMVSRLSSDQINELIAFCDNNLVKIKMVPDNKEIYTRAMDVELFGNVPILNLRKLPLDTDVARYTKRTFDIIFSSLVILLVLSWLVPIIGFLIKMESRGPVFFKQRRHGVNKQSFFCYKFRSMAVNKDADTKMMTKNDVRLTKIGKFIRKTSIDELPQFINVLKGDMSVVGPRPHMEAHTREYESSVDKYLVRHYAKPGITGLAQIKGYRGEVVVKSDIVNRTRLDIFYVEKWSLLLDVKIIVKTVLNAIGGEEKAY
ncbi:MAG: undecaprenyl-phosphate glucose phosphotransferase [Zunongwangia sp.]|uniref:Undecaprenyl-phosphate glucose phosphotransferase n=1 Tax=Zunongwangia profunda TaxID=398743 RepID=A0A3D5IVX7_9FLAO|nr:undecaprenyl-phosphate glucose phosphotransferase [Zunongwangia profunda]MAB91634.1 undecaprenyl-phosphate glucose phosphotransferase [Planctomycetota bacterium]MAO37970.1 undecaprenyl-phosphate glucose phosphotransferase [Zunongwangia sp.]MAS72481.1 undecaprenyl-phosphate glucose phosphotransferase [Zunongwangia sp.]HCV79937.1 undecaprenyl-phosphate glucose phosphotransferase [Zunongwangia profunda]|tara:strand:- start:9825 stop:11168 length:1344 start_codon:yes stop_codon:yes gene_type:complete